MALGFSGSGFRSYCHVPASGPAAYWEVPEVRSKPLGIAKVTEGRGSMGIQVGAILACSRTALLLVSGCF